MLNRIYHSLMGGSTGSKSITTSPRAPIVIRVLILSIHLFCTFKTIRLPVRRFGIHKNILRLADYALGVVAGRISALPRNAAYKVIENTVANRFEGCELIAVY